MKNKKLYDFINEKTKKAEKNGNVIYNFLEYMLADYIKTKFEMSSVFFGDVEGFSLLENLTKNDFDTMVESLYNNDELFEHIDTVVSDTLYDRLYDKQ